MFVLGNELSRQAIDLVGKAAHFVEKDRDCICPYLRFWYSVIISARFSSYSR